MPGFEEIHEETVRTAPDGSTVRTHRRTVRELSPEEILAMAGARMRAAEPPPDTDGIRGWFAHVRPSRA